MGTGGWSVEWAFSVTRKFKFNINMAKQFVGTFNSTLESR